MNAIIKSMYRGLAKKPINGIRFFFNRRGSRKKCYTCQNTFDHFLKYKNGLKDVPEFIRRLQLVGSDVENFKCPVCGSTDRERHFFMFSDKLGLWDTIANREILHIAPEVKLSEKISSLRPAKYIKGDLFPSDESIQKIDITGIPFPDNSFDSVICNHVLEHIPDCLQAVKEIFRVLKPKGYAILQTPYSKLLSRNFEEEKINTDELRFFFYGQEDHVRIFSEKQFFLLLTSAGFTLEVIKHSEFFSEKEADNFGVNKEEDLIKVIKP
jgi:SAM-dependent methyltransferase